VTTKINRRVFLALGGGAAGGLLLGYSAAFGEKAEGREFVSPFLHILPDNGIIFYNARSEMGQGVTTLLAQYVLDELDADWNLIREVRQASADREAFAEGWVPQLTVGAMSSVLGWSFYRRAGAQLRQVFLQAAAKRLGVPKEALRTELSHVIHTPTGGKLSYGDLAADASRLKLPAEPKQKDPSEFRYIGRDMPPLGLSDKVTGRAQYSIDFRRPSMKFAAIARCPVAGGKAISHNGSEIERMKGVTAVLEVPSGVAIVAETSWHAFKARRELEVEWEEGSFADQSSASLMKTLEEMRNNPEQTIGAKGDAIAVITAAEENTVHSAEYAFPFVAHATMEPMNATAEVTKTKCRVWAGSQNRNEAKTAIATLLNRPESDIDFNTTLMGGGFGRRSQDDFILEAVEVARRVDYPVQVVWSREDDMQHDYYRPMASCKLQAALSEQGKIEAWQYDLATISTKAHNFIIKDRSSFMGNGVAFIGVHETNYNPDHFLARGAFLDTPLKVGILRGISHGYVNFAAEVFVDELAEKAKRDPVEFRLQNLKDNARAQVVLQKLQQVRLTEKQDNWHEGVAYGYEHSPSYAYHSAVAAYVSTGAGEPKLEKIIAVFDHGRLINPDGFRQQVEGGLVFAVSMMFNAPITVEGGRVQESNFDSYPVARITDVPELEIHIIENEETPMGIGEKFQGTVQPAIANAFTRAVGKRIRGLPIKA